mmetsp:Transcript_7706/g.10767  ORF Transcript_7706/g.10767 Transcript_7706/m.10767 type:complete len:87 (+) Transcript_7706:40-300(+)
MVEPSPQGIFEDDGFKIQVTVSDPVQKESTINKFVIYNVKGEDKDGAFDVFRRYSDFHSLQLNLHSRWPGVFVPPIPPKKATGNLE